MPNFSGYKAAPSTRNPGQFTEIIDPKQARRWVKGLRVWALASGFRSHFTRVGHVDAAQTHMG